MKHSFDELSHAGLIPAHIQPNDVVLFTPSGSRLYGLECPTSDYDYYVVATSVRKPTQKIKSDLDVTCAPLSHFMNWCDRGVPQALEAMFSPSAEASAWGAFREAYRPNRAATSNTYRSFIAREIDRPEPKRRQHVVRWALNLRTLMEYGRFDPSLTQDEARFVRDAATSSSYRDVVRGLSGV